MNKPLVFVVGEPELHAALSVQPDLEVFPRHWDSLGGFLAAAKRKEIPGDHSPTVVLVSDAARQQDVNLEGFLGLVRELTVLVPWINGSGAPQRFGVVGVDVGPGVPLTLNSLRDAIARRAGVNLPAVPGGEYPLAVSGFQEPPPAPVAAPPPPAYSEPDPANPYPDVPANMPPPAPVAPTPQQPVAPQAPMPAQPVQPQQPMAPQPVQPQQPMAPQPVQPQQPMAPQPVQPQQPMSAQPVQPQQPMSAQPVQPQQPPSGQQPYPMAPPQPTMTAPQMGDAAWRPDGGPALVNRPPMDPRQSHLAGTEYSSNPFSTTRVIAVYSSKGGVGKSTMSLNLAARLAHVTDLEVCVIDLDVGFGDIGPRLGKFSPTIIEALREPQLDGDSIMRSLVTEEMTGVHALLAPLRPDAGADRSLLHPSAYDRVLRALRQRMHVVILDCSVDLADPLVGQFALTRADSIAVVVNNERATLLDAKRALDAMCRDTQGTRPGLGIPRDKIGVILNQKVDRVSVAERDIRQLLPEFPIVATIPDNRQLWVGETNLGRLLATAGIPEIDQALDSALMSLLPGLDLTPQYDYSSPNDAPPPQRRGSRRGSRGGGGRSGSGGGGGGGGFLSKLLGK